MKAKEVNIQSSDKRNMERRKKYLIEKKFQINFIIDFIKVMVIFLVFTGALFIIYYYFKYQHGEALFNEYLLEVKKGEPVRVINPFEIVLPVIIISVLLTSIFTIIYGLLYSHKIAGPIYRIKRTIDTISKGRLDFNVKLRNKDKFREVAGFLNILISSLNTKIKNIQGQASVLGKEINALQTLTEKQSLNKKTLKTSLTEIKKTTGKIKNALKDFKTK